MVIFHNGENIDCQLFGKYCLLVFIGNDYPMIILVNMTETGWWLSHPPERYTSLGMIIPNHD